jgi:hypothetical protein
MKIRHRVRKTVTALSLGALSALSIGALNSEAYACGGFFCNANLPVTQSAERIVFARDNGQLHMHVQINYQGPPTSFGWLLPTSPRVETAISSEAFFSALDRLYGPRFILDYNFDEGCGQLDFGLDEGDPQAAPPNSEPEVQVLSREAIGPYDRAILLPESVEALREWLDENEYQIPEDLDSKLQPYIDLDSAFVAIKLLPGLDAGDIVPLRLSFPGDRPSIPIIPTSVAADPDMGVIVHILDEARAIPVNYNHVTINEAAIDWLGQGQNYPSVVSQAVDEAGGRAFVTDYAGELGDELSGVLNPYSDELLARVSATTSLYALMELFDDRTNPDLHRVLGNFAAVPEGQEPSQFFRCVSCFGDEDQSIDGAQIAEALRVEINEVYEQINEVTSRASYLTRLYSTLSADEMDRDPSFSINPDLEPVSNERRATANVSCTMEPYEEQVTITLNDGRSYRAEEATLIERQDGETIRGQDVPAAASIEQMFEAGQPEVITMREDEEMTPGMMDPEESMAGAEASGDSASSVDDKDSGCQQRGAEQSLLWSLLLALLPLSLVRRREGQL